MESALQKFMQRFMSLRSILSPENKQKLPENNLDQRKQPHLQRQKLSVPPFLMNE